MTIAGIALMMALGAAAEGGQTPAPNPCQTPVSETAMVLGTTSKLYAELPEHLQFLPGGGPNDYVTTGYEYRGYNAMSGNPETGPFLVQQNIPRNAFVSVPNAAPCFGTTVNNPTAQPPFTIFKATLTAINQGGIPNSAPSDPSNPFVLARTRVGAVRLGR